MRRVVVTVILMLLGVPASAGAQRMPVTTFTRVNGLSHEYVFDVLTDSRGFVWLTTQDGISRYDGARFTLYGRRDGVPDRAVNTVLETRDGTIWVATNGGGVARFDPRGTLGADGQRLFFTAFRVGSNRRTNRVNRLAEDGSGGLWAATDGGLFHMAARGTTFLPVPLSPLGLPDDLYLGDVVTSQDGELWLATTLGLVLRLADGRGTTYVATIDMARPFVRRVMIDPRSGLIWALSTGGVLVLARPRVGTLEASTTEVPAACPARPTGGVRLPDAPGERCHLGVAQGLSSGRPSAIGFGRDGQLILGHAAGGLTGIVNGQVSVIEPANEEFDVSSLALDKAGNLWIGTQAGAKRVQRGGFVAYSTYDGMAVHNVRRVQLGDDRNVIVETYDGTMHWFEGTEVRRARFPLSPAITRPTWAGSANYRAPSGEWWVPTSKGLYRFASVDRLDSISTARPIRVYTTADGLAGDDISQTLMDSRGDLWTGHTSTGGPALSRLRAGASRFEVVPIEGAPQVTTVVSLAEDRSGQVWASMRDGGIARLRQGRMQFVPTAPLLPATNLFMDSRGRLWLCNADGLLRIEKPDEDTIRVDHYSTDEGLDRHALTLVEDFSGRMFLGTLNGIVQFEPDRRLVRQYTTSDGLPSSNVLTAVRDGRGDLWFGTQRGLARLRPSELSLTPPGRARISGVQVGDHPTLMSEFGDLEVSGLEVAPDRNRLRIDFFAMGGGSLPAQYQYRLSPQEPWSGASESRSVELAGLSPARYHFEVRALDPATGAIVPGTASVAFRVLPPLWQRWWFLALVGLAACAAGYLVHRSRLAGAVRMERIRARIATDLHDDIGSSLSQIAILSEVSRQRISNDPGTAQEPLGLIAETSRELVDKMSDIVWAVNPRRDSLSDLVYRMRRFADDTFGAADIAFRFTAPDSVQHLRLGPDVRRELLLILKESVTNIAKHARATEASVDLAVDGPRLFLTIRDNGRGFDPDASVDGNGVQSMRSRVQSLGGRLRIDSSSGQGTTVALEIHN